MGRRRVTIAGSMGLVALAAIAMASFRHPSPLVASGLCTAAVVAIFAAMVAAICLPGRRRAIWASFAACGAGYFYLGPNFGSEYGEFATFLTRPLIEIAHHRITGKIHTAYFREPGSTAVSPLEYWTNPEIVSVAFQQRRDRAYESAVQINHAIFVLCSATAGGLFALALTRTRAESTPKPPDHP